MVTIDEINASKLRLLTQLKLLKDRFYELFAEEFKAQFLQLVLANVQDSGFAVIRLMECGMLESLHQRTVEAANAVDNPLEEIRTFTNSNLGWRESSIGFHAAAARKIEEVINNSLHRFLEANGIKLKYRYSFKDQAPVHLERTVFHCEEVNREISVCQMAVVQAGQAQLKRKIAASWPKTTE